MSFSTRNKSVLALADVCVCVCPLRPGVWRQSVQPVSEGEHVRAQLCQDVHRPRGGHRYWMTRYIALSLFSSFSISLSFSLSYHPVDEFPSRVFVDSPSFLLLSSLYLLLLISLSPPLHISLSSSWYLSPPPPPAGLNIDGLYRVSGNLAVIQKLRFAVNHGRTVLPHC